MTQALNEYGSLDATALAALVRQRQVTPLELVDEAIRRLESVNGRLNAVVTTMFDQARAQARAQAQSRAVRSPACPS